MTSLPTVYGAVLLGGFMASVYVTLSLTRPTDSDWYMDHANRLSGVITAQTVTYIKQYPNDTSITKSIVNIAS